MNRRATPRLALMEQLLCMQRAGEWWHHSHTYDPQPSNRTWTRGGGHGRNVPLSPDCIPVDMRGNKSVIWERRQGERKQWRRGNIESQGSGKQASSMWHVQVQVFKGGTNSLFFKSKVSLKSWLWCPKSVLNFVSRVLNKLLTACTAKRSFISISQNMIGSASDWSVFVARKMKSLFAAHLFYEVFCNLWVWGGYQAQVKRLKWVIAVKSSSPDSW